MQAVASFLSKRHRETHFRATVDDTAGNKIGIIRDGQSVADGQRYPATAGLAASVAPGDEVFVVDINGDGGYFVVAEITR